MLMIRFQRTGRTNDPAYRIVVVEKARAAKTGRIVEQLGSYNPKTKTVILDAEKAKARLAAGAQATGTVHNLLVSKGVIEGKKVNVLPKKTVAKKEVPAPEAAPIAHAPAETPADAPETEAPAEEAAPAPAEETPAA